MEENPFLPHVHPEGFSERSALEHVWSSWEAHTDYCRWDGVTRNSVGRVQGLTLGEETFIPGEPWTE